MTNPTPVPPEMPKPAAETEKSGPEKKSFETVERKAESASREEERLIDQLAQLRSQMTAKQTTAAAASKEAALTTDIEQRKERIIANFVKAARAANFDYPEVERIMGVAEKYLRKEYPDIADEIHDRIINERSERDRAV